MVVENSRIPASAALSKSRLARPTPASTTSVSATQRLKHSQQHQHQHQHHARPSPLRRTSTSSSHPNSNPNPNPNSTHAHSHSHQSPPTSSQRPVAGPRLSESGSGIPTPRMPRPRLSAEPSPSQSQVTPGRVSTANNNNSPLIRSRLNVNMNDANSPSTPTTQHHQPPQSQPPPPRRAGVSSISRYTSPARHSQAMTAAQQRSRLPSPSPVRTRTRAGLGGGGGVEGRNPSPSPSRASSLRPSSIRSSYRASMSTAAVSPSPSTSTPNSTRPSMSNSTSATEPSRGSSNTNSALDYKRHRVSMASTKSHQHQQVQTPQKQQHKLQQKPTVPLSGVSRLTRSAKARTSSASSGGPANATVSATARLSAGGSARGPGLGSGRLSSSGGATGTSTPGKVSRPSDPHGRRLNPTTCPSSRPSDPSGFGVRGSGVGGEKKMSLLPRGGGGGVRDFKTPSKKGNYSKDIDNNNSNSNGSNNLMKSSRVSIRITPGRAPPLVESPYARGGRQQQHMTNASTAHHHHQHHLHAIPSALRRRSDVGSGGKAGESRVPDRPVDYTLHRSTSSHDHLDDSCAPVSAVTPVLNNSSISSGSSNGNGNCRGFPASVLANPPSAAGNLTDDRHLSTGSVDRLSGASSGSTRQRVSALESFRAARRASLQKSENEQQQKEQGQGRRESLVANDNVLKSSDVGVVGKGDETPHHHHETHHHGSDSGITDPDVDERRDPDPCDGEIDSDGIPLPPPPANEFARRLEAAAHSSPPPAPLPNPNPATKRWPSSDLTADSFTSSSSTSNHTAPLSTSPVPSRLSTGFDDQQQQLPDRPEPSMKSGMSMTSAIAAMSLLPDRPDPSLSADGERGLGRGKKASRFSDIEEEIDLGNVQKLRCSLRGRRSMADAHETPRLRRSSVGLSITGNIKVDHPQAHAHAHSVDLSLSRDHDKDLYSHPYRHRHRQEQHQYQQHYRQQQHYSDQYQPHSQQEHQHDDHKFTASRQPLRSIVTNASRDLGGFDVETEPSVQAHPSPSLRHVQHRPVDMDVNNKNMQESNDTPRHSFSAAHNEHASYSAFSTAVFQSRFGHLAKLDETDFGLENGDDVEDLGGTLLE